MRISVLIPTRSGGELLARVIAAVLEPSGGLDVELLLVDSGSSSAELARWRSMGARVESIDPHGFDHGATRDLAASRSSGEILVFLNQDALPGDSGWLARLTEPLSSTDPPAAVQGGIREFAAPELEAMGRRRFFWDSCGPRFYFTRESEEWIASHGGLGFSTVNCAIARAAWAEEPFGPAAILEDKLWQKRASARGWRIAERPDAFVLHSHDYSLGTLRRRVVAEGFGWRLVGVRYPARAALRDAANGRVWTEWRRGVRTRELRRGAELLFPIVRPLALWWGNAVTRKLAT